MSWFQVLVLPGIALLLISSVYRFVRSPSTGRRAAVSMVVWLVAGVAILEPTLLTSLANAIGIGRGADLVLYVVVLAAILAASYFYQRLVRAEVTISRIVRHLAILQAVREPGTAAATDPPPSPSAPRPS